MLNQENLVPASAISDFDEEFSSFAFSRIVKVEDVMAKDKLQT